MNPIRSEENRTHVQKLITEWREAGVSYSQMAKKLARQGYTNSVGNAVSFSDVSNFVTAFGFAPKTTSKTESTPTLHINLANDDIKQILSGKFTAETKLKLISALLV